MVASAEDDYHGRFIAGSYVNKIQNPSEKILSKRFSIVKDKLYIDLIINFYKRLLM